MLGNAVDKRKYSRISTVPPTAPEGDPPGHPRIMNVSQGGACLLLSDPPPTRQAVELQFRCDGQDHVLRSRVVWSRLRMAASRRRNPPRAEGWLAGIAFAGGDGDVQITDIPRDILRAGNATVSFLKVNEEPLERDSDADGEPLGVIALNEQSISGIKAATKDLIPVFAKHFSDVRLVFTRQRLEISATLRTPGEAGQPRIRLPDQRAIGTTQIVPSPAPVRAEPPAALLRSGKAQATNGRRRGFIAIAGLAAAIFGASLLGVLRKREGISTAPTMAPEDKFIPAWAQGLDGASLDGWIAVKTRFNLPDETARSAIQLLRNNDRYASAHDLHDLAKYPVQAQRAFSLLAGSKAAGATPIDLAPLKSDLESRLMAGARFPDEAPGGRYSSLQRELYNNVVVLAVVDLFYRRQTDPGVNRVLTALRRGRA